MSENKVVEMTPEVAEAPEAKAPEFPTFTIEEWQFIEQAVNTAQVQGGTARAVVALQNKLDGVREYFIATGQAVAR